MCSCDGKSKTDFQCVSSAAAVITAGTGCTRHQFVQNGPEHRVVTRRAGIQVRNSAEGHNNDLCRRILVGVNCYVCMSNARMANSRGPNEYRHGDVSATGTRQNPGKFAQAYF